MTRTAEVPAFGLVAAAVAGDKAAFERIVTAHHDDMRRVCIVVCGDEALAEDAVQSAWTIAWRKLRSLKDPGRLRPWLVAIAANQARDLVRGRRHRSGVEVVSDMARVPGGIDPATGVDSLDLFAAMKRLDPDDRALLAMRYVVGFNSTELSTALGISPSGTRNRLERLLARLRQDLTDG